MSKRQYSSKSLSVKEVQKKWYQRTALFRLGEMYRDGFRDSRLARTLLLIILFKVAILLLVFKLWLMPDKLSNEYDTDEQRADGVRNELINR